MIMRNDTQETLAGEPAHASSTCRAPAIMAIAQLDGTLSAVLDAPSISRMQSNHDQLNFDGPVEQPTLHKPGRTLSKSTPKPPTFGESKVVSLAAKADARITKQWRTDRVVNQARHVNAIR